MNTISEQHLSNEVDNYLIDAPSEARTMLRKIRSIIKNTVPQAEEVISYDMPAYKYHGMLVGFDVLEDYCEFDLMSPAMMKAFKERLAEYDTSYCIIRFPINKPLDVTLIKDLVQARKKENEFYAKMLC